MSDDRRNQSEPPAFRPAGIGMAMGFMCDRCRTPKLPKGKITLRGGLTVCLDCQTPEERAAPRGKAIYKRPAKKPLPAPIVLDWKAPNK